MTPCVCAHAPAACCAECSDLRPWWAAYRLARYGSEALRCGCQGERRERIETERLRERAARISERLIDSRKGQFLPEYLADMARKYAL